MSSYDPGHQEKALGLPRDPLASAGLWSFGTWGLPAATLSTVSVLVFGIVLGFLQYDRQRRALFLLPWDPVLLALPAVCLAWWILLSCRNRPGQHFPRYWALALAAMATFFAILTVAASLLKMSEVLVPAWLRASWLHAAVTAVFASVVSLLPRLVRFRPDSRLALRVAPLSLMLVLLLILPAAGWIGAQAIGRQRDRVDEAIRLLRFWTAEVEEVITAYDWANFMNSPDEASALIDRLAKLEVDRPLSDPSLWEVATILELDQDLAQAGRGLIDAVSAGIDPARTPKVSDLSEPAAWWDPVDGTWTASQRFPGLSALVGDYHRHFGRLMLALEIGPNAPAHPKMLESDMYYKSRSQEFREAVESLMTSFSDHWAVYRMPGHEDRNDAGVMPLSKVLQTSLNEDAGLAPAHLSQLLQTPLERSRTLASETTGCHPREYALGGDEYYRLDCYAYQPAARSSGAELRVEMRLVYGDHGRGRITRGELPSEVYFLFPITPGASTTAFRDHVMNELAAAVRMFWSKSLVTTDTSGSVNSGFVMRDGFQSISVYRPAVEDYHGRGNALVVRAEKQ